MALNLGPEAYDAIQRLKGSSEWRIVVAALQEQMNNFVLRAVAVSVDERIDATGYARALVDLIAHIELVEKPENRAPKPMVRAREGVRV